MKRNSVAINDDFTIVEPAEKSVRKLEEKDPSFEALEHRQKMAKMEKDYQTSFMDLSDYPIMNIIKYTDLRTRLRLRIMHSRLNRLERGVKYHLEEIYFRAHEYPELRVQSYDWNYNSEDKQYFPSRIPVRDFDELFDGLSRLSLNAHVQKINIRVYWSCSETVGRVVSALSKFKADELEIYVCWQFKPCIENLPSAVSLSQNFRKVNDKSGYLTSIDMCELRKIMLESDCKLELFCSSLKYPENFLNECFGITMEDGRLSYDDARGDEYNVSFSRTYRTSDETVELYTNDYTDDSVLYHFDGNLCTEINTDSVTCTKHKDGAKPGENLKRIKVNHLYKYWIRCSYLS